MKVKSIDEAIGPNQPHVVETIDTTTARTEEKLLSGVSEDRIPELVNAMLGLYLTGKEAFYN